MVTLSVRQLATELGVPSAKLIAMLRELGHYDNEGSPVDAEHVGMIRAYFSAQRTPTDDAYDNKKDSHGMKQIEKDLWLALPVKYPPGTRIQGKVRNLTTFGAFVEIEPGINGLVHVSDFSWTKRVHHPSEVVQKGQHIEVVVLDVDAENERISLGLKQLEEDPWDRITQRFSPGVETQGRITQLVDKGVMVDLGDDIEGFVPSSHAAVERTDHLEDYFAAGAALDLRVLESDPTNRRIVLEVTTAPTPLKDRPGAPTPETATPANEATADTTVAPAGELVAAAAPDACDAAPPATASTEAEALPSRPAEDKPEETTTPSSPMATSSVSELADTHGPSEVRTTAVTAAGAAPAADRVFQGVVKHFDERLGFGYIQWEHSDSRGDVRVRIAALRSGGFKRLVRDEPLKFTVTQLADTNYAAVWVDVRDSRRRGKISELLGSAFGRIQPDDGSASVFFRFRDVLSVGYFLPRVGEVVEYDVEPDRSNDRAVRIKRVEDWWASYHPIEAGLCT